MDAAQLEAVKAVLEGPMDVIISETIASGYLYLSGALLCCGLLVISIVLIARNFKEANESVTSNAEGICIVSAVVSLVSLAATFALFFTGLSRVLMPHMHAFGGLFK